MKVLIVLLLIVTSGARAQQHEEWLTPFATVEFTHNRIHYYFSSKIDDFRVKPVFIPTEKLILISVANNFMHQHETGFWKKAIREDAEGIGFVELSLDEKLHFLKAFTLQTIWGIAQPQDMPSANARLLVAELTEHTDKTISDAAKLAGEFYEIIIGANSDWCD